MEIVLSLPHFAKKSCHTGVSTLGQQTFVYTFTLENPKLLLKLVFFIKKQDDYHIWKFLLGFDFLKHF